jgi:hypothetical protein
VICEPEVEREIRPAGVMAAEVIDGVTELDAGSWDCGRRQGWGCDGDSVERVSAGGEDTTGLVE